MGTGRQLYTQQTGYLVKDIAYTDGNGTVVTIGQLPAGALIINAGVIITTAFNAGTANTMHLGTTADDDGIGTALALGTVGRVLGDEFATSNDLYSTSETAITATLTLSGTAPTTGAGFVFVEYIPIGLES